TTTSTPSGLQVKRTLDATDFDTISNSDEIGETSHSQKSCANTVKYFLICKCYVIILLLNTRDELLDLLKSANEGKALLAAYQEKGLLDSIGRRRLCNLIINKELRDDVNKRVPLSRLHELAYQITTVFNKECSAVYFIRYLSYGPGLKRAAKGKLLDCLNNRRRDYRKSGIINVSHRSSTTSSSLSLTTDICSGLQQFATNINPQIDVEENLKWLRNSSDPWKLVEENWDKTVHVRLNKIASKQGQSIVEYMTEFPALKNQLILKDFEVAFPSSCDKLYQNFPLYKKRIFELAVDKIKKSKELAINELLNYYVQFDVVDKEETSNIAALLCLLFIIGVNSTRIKKSKTLWRPSKLESRDGFITHVKSDAEILETITRRREKLASFEQTLQPFIIIVGPVINDISSYLVIVDNTYYRLNTIISAVDCYFKIILTLNAKYPSESELICINTLFTHFNFQHSYNTFDTFYCAEQGCLRSFNLKNSFRKHLQKHILDEKPHTSTPLTELRNNFPSDRIINIDNNYCNDISSESQVTANKIIDSAEILNKSIANFIASLYANPIIPRNVIQIVIDGVGQIFSEGLVIFIKNYVEQLTNKNKIPENCYSVFIDIENIIENAFICFKTEHKRFRYFAESESYIEPKEIIIGQRLNKSLKKGLSVLEPINCTEQFIPLRKVLKNFFSLDNILAETLEYLASLMDNKSVLGNFVQGTFWQSKIKKFEGKTVLPLFSYFDDFESGNVLGSHSGVHKVGAVYVSVPCIPLHRTSVLSNIFLALLFHSSDRVEFGNNVIFNPLINELNFLQETGIQIDTSVFKGTLYFDLGLIIGDNLGIHSIIGFTESFSSNYSCRICTINKNDLKFQCYEDESLLRSIDQYYMHLEVNNLSVTGIKEKCVWLDVKNFNLFDLVGVDLMHDILEGCAKYIMGFILSYYIKDLKLFSLQVLNDRLFAFDFGPEKNKPCAISMDHINVGNVKQFASEMLILVKYFGLIIGDLIPIYEPVWILYITLRKVLDIVLSPALEED
ncbi:SAM domain-containing protein, partial [Aphis craccivora]